MDKPEKKDELDAVRTYKIPQPYHFKWAQTEFTETAPWGDMESVVHHYGHKMTEMVAEFMSMIGPDMLDSLHPNDGESRMDVTENYMHGRWSTSFGVGESCLYQQAPGHCSSAFAEELMATETDGGVKFNLRVTHYDVHDRSQENLDTAISVEADEIEMMVRMIGALNVQMECYKAKDTKGVDQPQLRLSHTLTGTFSTDKVAEAFAAAEHRNKMVNDAVLEGMDPVDIKAKLMKDTSHSALGQLADVLEKLKSELEDDENQDDKS